MQRLCSYPGDNSVTTMKNSPQIKNLKKKKSFWLCLLIRRCETDLGALLQPLQSHSRARGGNQAGLMGVQGLWIQLCWWRNTDEIIPRILTWA